MANKVIAVHGFMYNPKDAGWTNPSRFVNEIDRLVARECVGFYWYSVPFGFELGRPIRSVLQIARAWIEAWLEGYWQPYRHAWALAKVNGSKLAGWILAEPEPVDLVCHSLGTRVALKAIEELGGRNIRRVVFLNGAELSSVARERIEHIVEETGIEILNVMVRGDQVLGRLGSWLSGDGGGPCIGTHGLGDADVEFWHNVVLDDAEFQARASSLRGWHVGGDDPKDTWDHHYTYRNPENQALIQAWLAGDNLDDLRAT